MGQGPGVGGQGRGPAHPTRLWPEKPGLLPRPPHVIVTPPPPPPPPACPTRPQVLENYNKGKTALLSAAKVMVSPTEVDLTPELIFQQQPLPTGPPVPAGLALELPTADHRNSSVR